MATECHTSWFSVISNNEVGTSNKSPVLSRTGCSCKSDSSNGLRGFDHINPICSTLTIFILVRIGRMSGSTAKRTKSAVFKCCFCLSTVQHPIVMCHQTHLGCFDCVVEQVRLAENQPKCALCRGVLNLRFDRLVSDMAPKKKRKRNSRRFEVFLQLLELKKKSKFKTFNRTLRKFAKAAETDAVVEQMSVDIANVIRGRVSAARLKSQRIYDANMYVGASI